MTAELNIAEVLYETGEVRFRYARIRSVDGSSWIRHGPFCEYGRSGQVISEGTYVLGSEQGVWRDFYENGQLAAEGEYRDGVELGHWRYWNLDGTVQTE
ncbi:toxin-antitoxin system YwqK family antitoxin [Ideonella sp.]|jgi:antitoxin component YwqK of YwqJK toxin-antitoxin module|uniref:toxin-antitoxin system YwqK family antitoxin n=1 Tax=Ideonella sp. TaxID=1929293 RepID=UPI0037BF17F1